MHIWYVKFSKNNQVNMTTEKISKSYYFKEIFMIYQYNHFIGFQIFVNDFFLNIP